MKRPRISVSMSQEELIYLKKISSKFGITMRELVLSAAFEKIAQIEEEELKHAYAWLAVSMAENLYKEVNKENKQIY